MAEKKIRVLIVDDSASVRQALAKVLTEEGDIEIIGAAGDPFMAAKKLQEDVPDVITLDVEMPKMDGITFLRKLMSQHPIPVVMCSSLTESGSETLMQAMEAGAVDVILKPKIAAADFLAESGARIRQTVRAAAQARLGAMRKRSVGTGSSSPGPAAKLTADAVLPRPPVAPWPRRRKWCAASAPPPAARKRCENCSKCCPPTRPAS